MRWAAIILAVLLALAVPAAADQRPDGFGGRDRYRVSPNSPRDCDALGVCKLIYYVKRDEQVYEVWACEGGQYILWPVACDEDPTQPPCKKV